LDVSADQTADDGGFGLTQLRELRSDVRNRTVVLTELAASGQARGGGSVTLSGQRSSQRLGTVEPVRSSGGDGLGAALFEPGKLVLCEGGDRLRTAAASKVAQGGYREVVVGVRKTLPPSGGERESPRRPPWTTTGLVRVGMSLDATLGLERVEVSADSGWRDA